MKAERWTKSLDKYEDFTGKLVAARPVLLNRKFVTLILENNERRIKVYFGSSSGLKTGSVYTVGHIGKKVINITPGHRIPDDK